MSYGWGEIVSIARQRRTADSLLIQGMIENRDRYNADVVVPQPDVSNLPAANRPGPNFFLESVDGLARSANATLPKVSCPVYNPESERERHLAEIRQGALLGAWYEQQLQLKLGRSYRHLTAYGTHAMVVMPDEKHGRADIQIRDPLTAFPELRAQDDIRSPKDCFFLFARSAQWITDHYPAQAPDYLAKSSSKGWDTLWDVIEWIDEDDIVIGIMGPRFPPMGYADARPYGYNAVELTRFKNKAGLVPVIAPRRVTLDRIMGQMTGMINYSDLFARMLSLQLVATEKAIFPDMAILSKTGMPPKLIGNKWQDGRSGNVNMIIDGSVEVIGKEAGPGTMPMLQLIDQHIRGSGGASPLYAGSSGGMRSGAGVDALGDYAVNPIVAEAQMVMTRSLEEVNRAWIAVQKGYFGDKKFTCYLGLGGSLKTVSYTPNKDFARDDNVVYYPAPGSDPNKLAVALTQLNATGIISARTARDMHPLVQDPMQEEQFIAVEKMTDATFSAMGQEVAQGTMSTATIALARKMTADGKDPIDALLEAAAHAATQGQAPGTPQGGPPGPATPGGAPMPTGLAQALAAQGAGPGQAPGNPIPAIDPGMANLRHVLQGVNENISPGAV